MLVFTVINIIKDYFTRLKSNDKCYLSISKWVFYFGAFSSILLNFGVIAELETLLENNSIDINSFLITVLFLTVIVFCIFLSILQKIWRIEYNNNDIIFRNTFDVTKKYKKQDARIKHKKELTQLFVGNKKVTEWPCIMVNRQEAILFEKYISNKRHR